MVRFGVKFQTIQNGKIVRTAEMGGDANSEREARQKFNSLKIPTNTVKYKIIMANLAYTVEMR